MSTILPKARTHLYTYIIYRYHIVEILKFFDLKIIVININYNIIEE